jgi:hypothetical protein
MTHQTPQRELISNLNTNAFKINDANKATGNDELVAKATIDHKELNSEYFKLMSMPYDAEVQLELEDVKKKLAQNTLVLNELIRQNNDLKNRSGIKFFLHATEIARQNMNFNRHMREKDRDFKQTLNLVTDNYNKLNEAQKELLHSMRENSDKNDDYQKYIDKLENDIIQKDREIEKNAKDIKEKERINMDTNTHYMRHKNIQLKAYDSLIHQIEELSRQKVYADFMQYVDNYEKGHTFLKYIDEKANDVKSYEDSLTRKKKEIMQLEQELAMIKQTMAMSPTIESHVELQKQLAEERLRSATNERDVQLLKEIEQVNKKNFDNAVADMKEKHDKTIDLIKRETMYMKRESSQEIESKQKNIATLEKENKELKRQLIDVSNELKKEADILKQYKRLKQDADTSIQRLESELNEKTRLFSEKTTDMSSKFEQSAEILRKQIETLSGINKLQNKHIDDMNHKLVKINTDHYKKIDDLEEEHDIEIKRRSDESMKELFETKRDLLIMLKKPGKSPDNMTIVSKELLNHIRNINNIIEEQRMYIQKLDSTGANNITPDPVHILIGGWKSKTPANITTVPVEILQQTLNLQRQIMSANNDILALTQRLDSNNEVLQNVVHELELSRVNKELVAKTNFELTLELEAANKNRQQLLEDLQTAQNKIKIIDMDMNWDSVVNIELNVPMTQDYWIKLLNGEWPFVRYHDSPFVLPLNEVGHQLKKIIPDAENIPLSHIHVITALLKTKGPLETLYILNTNPNYASEVLEHSDQPAISLSSVTKDKTILPPRYKKILRAMSLSTSIGVAMLIIADRITEDAFK